LPSGPDIVSGELHDHQELTRLLRKLDDAGSEEVAHRLIDFARAHMEAEERTLFPLLRRVVEPADLDAVGEEIRMNREADRSGTP
jgi:hemerythrin-like domain-containing protein